jgi:hypothetical protein
MRIWRSGTNNPSVLREIKQRTSVVGAFPDGQSAALSAMLVKTDRKDACGNMAQKNHISLQVKFTTLVNYVM